MANVAELGQRVKSKYPGQYDDLDDAEVGRRVKSKFPGAYDDFSDDQYGAPPPVTGKPMSKEDAAKYVRPLPKGAEEKTQGSALRRALGAAWDTVKGGAELGAAALRGDPVPLYGMAKATRDQASKAVGSFSKGRVSEGVGHALGAVPMLGTSAASIGERIGGAPEMPPPQRLDSDPRTAEEATPPDLAGGLTEAGMMVAPAIAKLPVVQRGTDALGRALATQGYKTGAKMYQSILKPSTVNTQAQNARIINTGLKERIPLTKGGRNTLQGKVDALQEQVGEHINRGDAAGLTVDPEAAAARTTRSKAEFATQVDPDADLNAISGVKGRFLDRHSTEAPYTKIRPTDADEAGIAGAFVKEGEGTTRVSKPIGLKEAQAEKQGTYRRLKDKYGELSSAEVEAQKDIARGLKEEVYNQVKQQYGVDLTAIGQREARLLDLDGSIERFLNRHGNNQSIGIAPGIHAAGLRAMFSRSAAITGALANFFLEKNPAIASRIAILAANQNPTAVTGFSQAVAGGLRGAQIMAPPPLPRLDQ